MKLVLSIVLLSAMQADMPYAPTSLEADKLASLQKDVIIVEGDIEILQLRLELKRKELNEAYIKLITEGDIIRRRHDWPNTVKMNPQTLRFESTN